MSEQKRILFLYSELANYFLLCAKQLQLDTNAAIHVIHWPLNKEAPFNLDLNIQDITFYNRKQFDQKGLSKLVKEINPHLIYCSGWIDKEYVNICSAYKNNIPVLGGFDTPWNGSLKQRLHSTISALTVKKYFSHLWIAGQPQLKYAQKLGFDKEHILTGVYSADVPYFNNIFIQNARAKEKVLPKRFIFVGRYLEFKGIFDLWAAFIKTFEYQQHEWELWCLGTGALWDKRVEHPKIKHVGFVQPHEMDMYLEQTSVFVLPSHFEPWAVALHEFAAAGFPLLSSDKVGAATRFLEEGKNGFLFPATNVDALTQGLLKYIQMDPNQINAFAKRSNELAKEVTPTTWAKTIAGLI